MHKSVQKGAERERRRLARELHDGLAQDLAWATLELRRLQREANLDQTSRHRLDEVTSTVERLAGRVRQLSHQLHPAKLEILGLGAALRMLAREFESHFGVEIVLALDADIDGHPAAIAQGIYRIVQEALSNAARHAGATEIAVRLTRGALSLDLLVEDWGVGLDLAEARAGPGLGLIAMEERAQALGGFLTIDSQLGSGTCIRASFPLMHSPSPASFNDVKSVPS